MFNKRLRKIPDNGRSFVGEYCGDPWWSDGCVVVFGKPLRPVSEEHAHSRALPEFGPAHPIEPVGYIKGHYLVDHPFLFSDGTVVDGRYLVPFVKIWDGMLTFEAVEFCSERISNRPIRVLASEILVGYLMPLKWGEKEIESTLTAYYMGEK